MVSAVEDGARILAVSDRFVEGGLPPITELPHFLDTTISPVALNRNFTVSLLDDHLASGNGQRIALQGMESGRIKSLSYDELSAKVCQAAQVLAREMGVQAGNRVLLRGPNTLMLAICWLAVIRIGAVAVTTMPLLRSKELCQIVEKVQIAFALCDARYLDELELARDHFCGNGKAALVKDILHFNTCGTAGLESRMAGYPEIYDPFPSQASDPAIIAFTSGTTGLAKGTVHFHRDLYEICEAFPKHILQMTPDDRCCGTPPLGFTFGLGGLLCFPLYWGGSSVLAEKPDKETLLQLAERCQATIIFTAPTLYRQMSQIAGAFNLASLRAAVSAGEALSVATREAWQAATGIKMIDGLGSTEMLHIFVSSRADDYRDGAIGKAVPGYEIAIVDSAMTTLPAGEIGLLAVKGVTGCRYLTDERQRNYVKSGWNLPGDVGYMDGDGYLYYVGRADDMIISAGYSISGAEVEEALLRHPDVAECAVVGIADEVRGQLIEAHVVLRQGISPGGELAQELQNFVKNTIAPYKYPRSIKFSDRLPRTESGKLQRFKLRSAATVD